MKDTGSFLSKCVLLSLIVIFSHKSNYAQNAPDFTFTDVNGETHNLYHALDQGFIVLLDFFYTECGPCQASSSEIQKIFEDYEGKNVLVFSLSDRDTDAQIHEFRETLGLEYIQGGEYGGGKDIIHQYNDEFDMVGFPTISIICPDGTIDWDIFPYSTGAPEWRERIDSCGVDNWETYQPIGTTATNLRDYSVNQDDIAFYPNPTSTQSNLKIVLEEEAFVSISIFDAMGKSLGQSFEGVLSLGTQNINIQTDHLPTGYYHLKIHKNAEEIKNIRFLKI